MGIGTKVVASVVGLAAPSVGGVFAITEGSFRSTFTITAWPLNGGVEGSARLWKRITHHHRHVRDDRAVRQTGTHKSMSHFPNDRIRMINAIAPNSW